MKRSILAAMSAAASLVAVAAYAQPAPAELPAALRPSGIYGAGINVVDLEAQKAWYTSMLGMKLVNTLSRDGKPFEYLMGTDASGPILALLKTERPAGPNGFSRVILATPDAKALAQRLQAQGVPMREVAPGVAYFITDPEGNAVELLKLSK